MINNEYKLIALILASCALLFFLIGVILYGTSSGNVSEESIEITSEVNEIEVGWNYQLEVKKKIDDNHHLEYKSSNDDILTISDTGYMNAIKSGEVISFQIGILIVPSLTFVSTTFSSKLCDNVVFILFLIIEL